MIFLNFLKKKPKHFREFVARVDGTLTRDELVIKTIEKANELGFQGKKVTGVERRPANFGDPMQDTLWLVGEKK